MSNFLKIDRLLTKNFTQNFKERYHHKRKESQVSIWKAVSQKKHPKKNLPKTWAYTNHSIFLKDLLGLEKLHLPLKDYMDGYFWLSLREHIFAGFLTAVILRPMKKYTAKKTRNSVNENSSNVRRNTSPQERWKNHAKRRQALTCT